MKSWKLLGLLPLLSLSMCASPSAGIKASCAVFKPITYSSKDTPETQAQVESHDVTWLRVCQN